MKELDRAVNPVKTGNLEVDRALQEMADVLEAMRKHSVKGVTVAGLRPAASPTVIKVKHGLGRKPEGWFPCGVKNATPNALHELPSTNPEKELWLHYTGSTDIVLDIRVY